MAQVLIAVAICALGGYLFWRYADRLFDADGVHVNLRLDRPEPGAHLIWDIVNTSPHPVTLTKLIVHGRGKAANTVPLGLPKVLARTIASRCRPTATGTCSRRGRLPSPIRPAASIAPRTGSWPWCRISFAS